MTPPSTGANTMAPPTERLARQWGTLWGNGLAKANGDKHPPRTIQSPTNHERHMRRIRNSAGDEAPHATDSGSHSATRGWGGAGLRSHKPHSPFTHFLPKADPPTHNHQSNHQFGKSSPHEGRRGKARPPARLPTTHPWGQSRYRAIPAPQKQERPPLPPPTKPGGETRSRTTATPLRESNPPLDEAGYIRTSGHTTIRPPP